MNLDRDARATLLKVARDAIVHGIDKAGPCAPAIDRFPAPLRERASTFVTLRKHGALRGCIGNLRASRPLIADVAEHAFAAAFSDSRFAPVESAEVAELHIHISILSPLQAVPFDADTDLLSRLRAGVDGLLIDNGSQRATFLPTVWSSFPDGMEFLAALKNKAGIARDASDYEAWRYTTLDIEEGHGAPAA